MANIVILGAGVMGSALAATASTHSTNNVTLVGSPLDNAITTSVNHNRHHPTLRVDISDEINCVAEADLADAVMHSADIIVIGVSSPGVSWAVNKIKQANISPTCIALVTKGLVSTDNPQSPPLTYADALSGDLDNSKLLGIAGPCIARELALGMPTFVTFAARDPELAKQVQGIFQTDTYRISVHPDFVGLEACAALKNFYCIGVSAMLGAWQVEGQTAKNPVAALFNQAVIEMNIMCNWIRDASESDDVSAQYSGWSNVAFDLPGMGDLHVTVGGGRNSRLGTLLGQGHRLSEIVEGPMKGVTVEGLDTGRQLLSSFRSAVENGSLNGSNLPLTTAILNSIGRDSLFEYDFHKH